jgi:hypothetical protein
VVGGQLRARRVGGGEPGERLPGRRLRDPPHDHGRQRQRIGTGRSHRSKLLDVLATIATHDPATIDRSAARPTPSTRARRPAGGTVALVTSERGEGDDLRRLAAVATSTDLVVVVVQRSVGASTRRAGGARTGRGTRVVRLGPGDALASVWDPTA